MLFTGHLTIFAITFFYNDSDREITMKVRKHIQVSVKKKIKLVGRCILGVTLRGK
jgi:hypothetical protein